MKKITPVAFIHYAHQFLSGLSKLKQGVGVSIWLLSIQLITVNSFAQYTKLSDFGGVANGRNPSSDLFFDGTFLYGTTRSGGTNNNGTIFKIKTDGTGYTKLLDFDDFTGNVNGIQPWGSLIFDGTFLYGMTTGGGSNNFGTIFKIKSDGSGYVKLLDFANITNGEYPYGALISDGIFLYGMTSQGGTNGSGTIFKIKTDGTGYVKLLDFGSTTGRYPYGSLISEGSFLYGMADDAVSSAVVFKIRHDGTGYEKLYDFTGPLDGRGTRGSLISDGAFLYGMTQGGGILNVGTIFKIRFDGTGYEKLHDFSGSATDGGSPYGSLIFDGSFLYGMASAGGLNTFGTIFKLKPDGTEYSNLLNFAGGPEARQPLGSLVSDGTFLYGTSLTGGVNSQGTIFKYAPTSIALPTIISFAPPSGPIGTTVIITGTNFSTTPADNTVRFNGTLATVTASSATSITTTVPIGASTGTITVTVGGNTATSATSFIVTTSATINFTTQPTNTTLCEGNNAAFSLVASGDTNLKYQWQIDNGGFVNLVNSSIYSGVNTANLIISNTLISLDGSIYQCNVMGDNSINTASGNATLTVKPSPTATISLNGTQLIASAGDNYQWYQNDVTISGATNQVLELMSVLEYGVYAVDVSVNGCIRTSIDFEYLITKNESHANGWKIYPNPFTTTLSIESSTTEPMEIEIVDVLGRSVKRIPEFNSDTIFLNELQEGSYFLTIHTARQSAHFRIVKAH